MAVRPQPAGRRRLPFYGSLPTPSIQTHTHAYALPEVGACLATCIARRPPAHPPGETSAGTKGSLPAPTGVGHPTSFGGSRTAGRRGRCVAIPVCLGSVREGWPMTVAARRIDPDVALNERIPGSRVWSRSTRHLLVNPSPSVTARDWRPVIQSRRAEAPGAASLALIVAVGGWHRAWGPPGAVAVRGSRAICVHGPSHAGSYRGARRPLTDASLDEAGFRCTH